MDIYGRDDRGRFVGVQCKLVERSALIKDVVVDETGKAAAFRPSVEVFYVATTGPRDQALQLEVRLLSADRAARGLFPVEVLFWEDLRQDLVGDLDAVRKHYPHLLPAPAAHGIDVVALVGGADQHWEARRKILLACFDALMTNSAQAEWTDPAVFGGRRSFSFPEIDREVLLRWLEGRGLVKATFAGNGVINATLTPDGRDLVEQNAARLAGPLPKGSQFIVRYQDGVTRMVRDRPEIT